MSDAATDTAYWALSAEAVAASLGSGATGLTAQQAAAQLAALGPNSVEDAPRLTALRLLLRQFESPLVLILAIAAVLSLVLQQWVDAGIILAIVLGSSLLGFYQEYRASTAVEDLKKRLALGPFLSIGPIPELRLQTFLRVLEAVYPTNGPLGSIKTIFPPIDHPSR